MSPSLLEEFAAGQLPGLCWLDGGSEARGVVGRRPVEVLRGDSLACLDELEARWRAQPERPWIGWISYDLGAGELLGRGPRPGLEPQLCMRQYAALEHAGPTGLVDGPARPWPLAALEPAIAAEDYRARVRAAKAHVLAGDTYQVNLSQRFVAPWRGDAEGSIWARSAAVYRRLREATPATMGALIAIDDDRGGRPRAIVSNSPETLVDLRLGAGSTPGSDRARSWPIKGTRPRHRDRVADAKAAAELQASAKDRAEHVMIVDLVRNDLGTLAIPGTVVAPREPELVSLPTVHHMVSEVACDLAPGWSLRELFAVMFPGGSITGAPKRRTVEIIDELEAEPRGIYCGAIVLLEAEGLRASIPIRTGVLDEAGLELRSGGGIVADSDPEAERLETLAKARAFDIREWR